MKPVRRIVALAAILWPVLPVALAADAPPAAAPPPVVDCSTPTARTALPEPAFARCVDQLVAQGRRSPGTVSPAALNALVGEVTMRSIATSTPSHVEAIEALAGELERRHETTPLQRAAVVWVLQLNGRYDEARQRQGPEKSMFTSAFPRRVASVSPRRAGDVQAWGWDAKADTLTERFIDLSQGAHVIVRALPSCHFCAQAAVDIEADAGLRKAFAEHAIWIDRPFAGLEQDAMLDWTSRHPDMPMSVMHDPAGWPAPKSLATPDFLYVRDGRLVREIMGWQPGHEEDTREALRAIGIDPSP